MNRTSPLLDALLSCLCTGLGQMYCGRPRRGAVLFGISLLFAPCTMVAAQAAPSTVPLAVFLLAGASFVGATLYSVVDAVRLARRQAGATPKPLRPAIYALAIALGMSYPVCASLFLRATSVRAYYIPTASMAPTLQRGDRVLADVSSDGARAADYGDMIVFPNPADSSQLYVKRLVAMPGDRLAVRDGHVVLNGNSQPRFPVPQSDLGSRGDEGPYDVHVEAIAGVPYHTLSRPDERAPDFQELLVPAGHCFVLGDNRDRSVDSRQFGTVLMEDIEGVARYLFYEGLGVLGEPEIPPDYRQLIEQGEWRIHRR